MHLSARRRRKRADEEIAKSGAGVNATALPTTDHVIALGDEIGSTPELEVRERSAEIHHKTPHLLATPARRMQRILEQHVRGGEFVDDLGVPRITPEPVKPASNEGLVFLVA